MSIIEMKDVVKKYGNGTTALRSVSINVEPGEFAYIVGPSGAGKSTLFNVIAGTLPLTSGSIHILGENVTHFSPEKRAKYLSRVFQDPKMGTAPRMTVAENLLIAKFRGEKRGLVPRGLNSYREEFQATIEKIGNGLDKHLDTPIEFLSGGQRQALSLLMATLKRPELLLLDEPSMGLAPIFIQEIFDIIQDIQRQGTTVLLIEQNANKALSIADRGYVLETGKIVLSGTGQELLASDEVRKAYLGG